MMDILKEFKRYILEDFPFIKLKGNLFFESKNALRFDLQTGNINNKDYFNEEYFKNVIYRSTTLFESIFSDDDEIYIVLFQYRFKRRKIRFSNYCFKQINGIKKSDVSYSTIKNRYDKTDADAFWNMSVLKTQTKMVAYKNIITAIAHTDFPPLKPRFDIFSGPEIFFINIEKKIIFYMYDDRGLDVVAKEKAQILPLFTEYNSWILDANKEQIEQHFAA